MRIGIWSHNTSIKGLSFTLSQLEAVTSWILRCMLFIPLKAKDLSCNVDNKIDCKHYGLFLASHSAVQVSLRASD